MHHQMRGLVPTSTGELHSSEAQCPHLCEACKGYKISIHLGNGFGRPCCWAEVDERSSRISEKAHVLLPPIDLPKAYPRSSGRSHWPYLVYIEQGCCTVPSPSGDTTLMWVTGTRRAKPRLVTALLKLRALFWLVLDSARLTRISCA